MTADERLIELEARYAHLEDLTEKLNEVVYQQQRELSALHAAVDVLLKKNRASEGQVVDATVNERPPHY
jgi:SlyX protein